MYSKKNFNLKSKEFKIFLKGFFHMIQMVVVVTLTMIRIAIAEIVNSETVVVVIAILVAVGLVAVNETFVSNSFLLIFVLLYVS
jgi:hypothetical protein